MRISDWSSDVCSSDLDRFTTMSGRAVELGIWVRAGDLDRTHHAMTALKHSMKWDEEVYGREYDLDRFNIVAVSDFNMGAMENKGLNIFNTRYILADRSEEHKSELQSLMRISYAVFCLKKTKTQFR